MGGLPPKPQLEKCYKIKLIVFHDFYYILIGYHNNNDEFIYFITFSTLGLGGAARQEEDISNLFALKTCTQSRAIDLSGTYWQATQCVEQTLTYKFP